MGGEVQPRPGPTASHSTPSLTAPVRQCPNVPANSRQSGPRAPLTVSYPAISLTTATVGRHRHPQKRLQTAADPASTRIRAPTIHVCYFLSPLPVSSPRPSLSIGGFGFNRYLEGEDCQWERMGGSGASNGVEENVFSLNHAPATQGIEMRVYKYAEPSDGSESDDEGICLSIIDLSNRNGMILNGFALHLEAMQFGDTLWNDHFLSDTGIMERMIMEKRVVWDQMQQEIIVGHYALFM